MGKKLRDKELKAKVRKHYKEYYNVAGHLNTQCQVAIEWGVKLLTDMAVEKEQPKEVRSEYVVIKLKKDYLDKANIDSLSMYDFCKKHKIQYDEPRNSQTQRYDTAIITLKTPKDKILFEGRYLKYIHKITEQFKGQEITDADIENWAASQINGIDPDEYGYGDILIMGAKAHRDGLIKSSKP